MLSGLWFIAGVFAAAWAAVVLFKFRTILQTLSTFDQAFLLRGVDKVTPAQTAVLDAASGIILWLTGYRSGRDRETPDEFLTHYFKLQNLRQTFFRLFIFYLLYTGVLTALTVPVLRTAGGGLEPLPFTTERLYAYSLLLCLIIANVIADLFSLRLTMHHLSNARKTGRFSKACGYMALDLFCAGGFFLLVQLVSNSLYPMTVGLADAPTMTAALNFSYTFADYAVVINADRANPEFALQPFPGQLLISGTTIAPTLVVLVTFVFTATAYLVSAPFKWLCRRLGVGFHRRLTAPGEQAGVTLSFFPINVVSISFVEVAVISALIRWMCGPSA